MGVGKMPDFRSYSVGHLDLSSADLKSDLLIYSVGYETRSSFIARHESFSGVHGAAIVYRDRQQIAFSENLAACRTQRHIEWSDAGDELAEALSRELARLRRNHAQLHISVDVSAMDRGLMARVILGILDELGPKDRLDVLYAPSAFSNREAHFLPIRKYGAAHPRLAGRLTEPLPQSCLILGLGFDYGVALNILDMHDPDYALMFAPRGFDSRFEQAVRSANFNFDFGRDSTQIIHYPLNDLPSLFDYISSLIEPLRRNTKIIFAPMGPKIFSAISIIQSYFCSPDVTLLRYSLVGDEIIDDVSASGEIIGLSIEFNSARGVPT